MRKTNYQISYFKMKIVMIAHLVDISITSKTNPTFAIQIHKYLQLLTLMLKIHWTNNPNKKDNNLEAYQITKNLSKKTHN